ncbi:putative ribonuclease H-like domain-containing protein, partial [Tanacetum coccineum]
VKKQPNEIFISQDKNVADILKKFDFCSIRTATTPIESHKPLIKDEDGVDVDVHVYRSMIGSLMYLTASRPDIMFAVCACARFQVTPKASHLHAVKRIFRNLKHQPKLGLWYPRDSPFELEAFSDSDYGGASLHRKSTTEYVAAANCCGQVLWIHNQMMDYGFNFMNTKIHIDNESTMCIVKNPVYHSRTKHIEIRHHFIRDCYEKRLINVLKIHTDNNVADLLTKGFYVISSQIVNDVKKINATIDSKAVVVIEASIRSSLLFNDADGTACLTNEAIFQNLALMGYEGKPFNDVYATPAHTQKVFTNMSRKGLKFSGKITPLFPNMLTQAVVNVGEGLEQPTEPQPTPSPTQPSTIDQPLITASSSGPKHTHSHSLHLEGAGGIEGDQELFVLCTNLSNRVLTLETAKNAQAAEIIMLKKGIKKLKQKSKPVISHHRAWLRSMQKLSMKKRFGKKESVSKQGRKKAKPKSTLDDSTIFDDQDVDHGMDYMEAVDEGKKSDETEEVKLTVDTEEVVEDKDSDSVVEPKIPHATSIFDDEDITMAQTLIKMKEVKAKEKGVLIKDVEDSLRPERSVLTLKPLPIIDPKDKEIEREKEERQKQDQAYVDYIANLYDEVQAEINVDALFAAKLQQEEREEYTIEESAKFLVETIAAQRKFRATQRSAEIRSRPPTKSQLRNSMMTYLRHMGGFKHYQLKLKTFEEIQGLYERQKRIIDDFKLMDLNDAVKDTKEAAGVHKEKVLEEPDSTKIEVKQEEHTKSTRKRSGRRLKMKATKRSKRKKTDSDLEEEKELKVFLKIVPDEEGEVDYEVLDKKYPIVNWESKFYHTDRYGKPHEYYKVFRFDGSSRSIKTFSEMVTRFDRMDLEELYNLVMRRFATTTPEGIDLILWGSLRTMFKANADDDLWKNQEKWILKSWNFYEKCGVHILMLEDSTEFYMLAEGRKDNKDWKLIIDVIEPNDSVSINSIIESKDAIFDENRFSSVPRPSLMILNGTEDIGGSMVPKEVPEEVVQQLEPELRKSKRNRTPKYFGPKFQLYLIKGTRDEDVAFWKEAINDEIDSIMGNNTWVLADLPLCCKPLGCKWTFKRKIKVDGTIEKFKARLVIQGFKQKSRIDYFDTYAPVARISTIRLLIVMASIHNLIIHQMDIKTAFLNGDLDKEVDLTKEFLSSKFSMKDMGEDDVILGIWIKHGSNGIAISQSHYIKKAVSQLEYSKVIGCLMYAMTCTRPDIAFAVGKLSGYVDRNNA